MNTEPYDRENVLKSKFDSFCTEIFGNRENGYYASLTVKQYHQMKIALSTINNIITYKTTIQFAQHISQRMRFDETEKAALFEVVRKTKPNAPGFDIRYEGTTKILAEIKCNIQDPVTGLFKSNQKDKIASDVRALLKGKGDIQSTQDYYKFMVFWRFDDLTEKAIRFARGTVCRALRKDFGKGIMQKIEYETPDTVYSKDKVYFVILEESTEEMGTSYPT